MFMFDLLRVALKWWSWVWLGGRISPPRPLSCRSIRNMGFPMWSLEFDASKDDRASTGPTWFLVRTRGRNEVALSSASSVPDRMVLGKMGPRLLISIFFLLRREEKFISDTPTIWSWVQYFQAWRRNSLLFFCDVSKQISISYVLIYLILVYGYPRLTMTFSSALLRRDTILVVIYDRTSCLKCTHFEA